MEIKCSASFLPLKIDSSKLLICLGSDNFLVCLAKTAYNFAALDTLPSILSCIAMAPLNTVTRWLGNSPDVARKHYLQITPDDIAKATAMGTEEKSAK